VLENKRQVSNAFAIDRVDQKQKTLVNSNLEREAKMMVRDKEKALQSKSNRAKWMVVETGKRQCLHATDRQST
jgi:hypothetical protein